MCDEEICELRMARLKEICQKLVGRVNWMQRERERMPGLLLEVEDDVRALTAMYAKLRNAHPIPKEVK